MKRYLLSGGRAGGPVLAWAILVALTVAASGPLMAQVVSPRGRTHHVHFVARGPGKANVSLNVDHAPIRGVLRLLFRRANQSYVFGSGVTGTVTASLHHIPFATALNQVLAVNSVPLTKTLKNGVYIIKARHRVHRRTTTTRRATTTQRTTTTRRTAPRRQIVYPYRRRRIIPRPYVIPGSGGGVRVLP